MATEDDVQAEFDSEILDLVNLESTAE